MSENSTCSTAPRPESAHRRRFHLGLDIQTGKRRIQSLHKPGRGYNTEMRSIECTKQTVDVRNCAHRSLAVRTFGFSACFTNLLSRKIYEVSGLPSLRLDLWSKRLNKSPILSSPDFSGFADVRTSSCPTCHALRANRDKGAYHAIGPVQIASCSVGRMVGSCSLYVLVVETVSI